MAHATIVAHPAVSARGDAVRLRTGPAARPAAHSTARPTLRTLAAGLAAPVLAVVLAWGLVETCAFTQHSLMALYTASSPVAS